MIGQRHAVAVLVTWLGLGLLLGEVVWPYQLISELGFVLQERLWLQNQAPPWLGVSLVLGAATLLLGLAWGPLAKGRGGGLKPVLALQCSGNTAPLDGLDLSVQLKRLALMLLTHLAGLTVGVESPSAALGASLLLALRRRWPHAQAWAALPIPLVAAIGAGAGLGAAFRSPLLGAVYAVEELSLEKGFSLVLPTLLLSGSGAILATTLGQPARLEGVAFGALPSSLWAWAMGITLVASALGA